MARLINAIVECSHGAGGSCQDAPQTLSEKFRELDANPRQGIQEGDEGP